MKHIKAQALVIMTIYLLAAFITLDFGWVVTVDSGGRAVALMFWIIIGFAAACIVDDAT